MSWGGCWLVSACVRWGGWAPAIPPPWWGVWPWRIPRSAAAWPAWPSSETRSTPSGGQCGEFRPAPSCDWLPRERERCTETYYVLSRYYDSEPFSDWKYGFHKPPSRQSTYIRQERTRYLYSELFSLLQNAKRNLKVIPVRCPNTSKYRYFSKRGGNTVCTIGGEEGGGRGFIITIFIKTWRVSKVLKLSFDFSFRFFLFKPTSI